MKLNKNFFLIIGISFYILLCIEYPKPFALLAAIFSIYYAVAILISFLISKFSTEKKIKFELYCINSIFLLISGFFIFLPSLLRGNSVGTILGLAVFAFFWIRKSNSGRWF